MSGGRRTGLAREKTPAEIPIKPKSQVCDLTGEQSRCRLRSWTAGKLRSGSGEGQKAGTSSFLSCRPLPQSEFLLAANQDDEGDDTHDELTDVYEQCCECHKRTVPLSRRLRFR